MKDVIRTKALSFSIEDRQILKEVSIKVQEGRTVGIIGPNGSGKTTFLKHIYRALPVDKGKVFVDDEAIENISFKDTAKKLAVLKQENSRDFDFSVWEMVLLGRSPYHNYFEDYNDEDKKIAEKALLQVGMEEHRDKSFGTLSGGEKQRVLMARAIAQGTDIFIMDEPTNHLDVHYQWSIMELIDSMKKTVLGVFHELNLASRFCDYLYVLQNGRIVAEGEPKDVVTTQLMEKVFAVKAEITDVEGHPYIIFRGTK
ncbi:MAG: ABC transporter ATP-binding protein [Butyrivibrio sp.]|nr:ABC transporter ATP-binding protein [Butyrivibrio sp.]